MPQYEVVVPLRYINGQPHYRGQVVTFTTAEFNALHANEKAALRNLSGGGLTDEQLTDLATDEEVSATLAEALAQLPTQDDVDSAVASALATFKTLTVKGPWSGTAEYDKNDLVSTAYGLWVALYDDVPVGNMPGSSAALPGWTSLVAATAFPFGDLATNFTPTENITFTEFEYWHAGGTGTAGTIGFASAVTSALTAVPWLNANSIVNVPAATGAAGWRKITLPAPLTLSLGVAYSIVWLGAGVNVGYWSDVTTPGIKMTIQGSRYNSRAATGPDFNQDGGTIRTTFRLLVPTIPPQWKLLSVLPGLQPNSVGDAIIPMDISDSFIIGSDRMEHESVVEKQIRMFFNKAIAAFRAGRFTYAITVGNNSAAFGTNPGAQASESFAAGYEPQATATAAVAMGYQSTAAQVASFAAGESAYAGGRASRANGQFTRADGTGAAVDGVYANAPRLGQRSVASGRFSITGDAQKIEMVLRRVTSDASPGILTAVATGTPALTGNDVNVLTLPVKVAHKIKIDCMAKRTDAGGGAYECAGFTWEGVITRDFSGNARIVDVPIEASWTDAAAATWTMAVSIDTSNATNNYLAINVTGEAGKTIRWVAAIESTEVTF